MSIVAHYVVVKAGRSRESGWLSLGVTAIWAGNGFLKGDKTFEGPGLSLQCALDPLVSDKHAGASISGASACSIALGDRIIADCRIISRKLGLN